MTNPATMPVNLATTPGWDAVPQWEKTTPLMGGPSGEMNAQALALANRSEWLRAQTVNVRDPRYGAKGDGVTDDTAAIQAAVNAAGVGGTVYFPGGKFVINGTITRLPGQILRGAGWATVTGSYDLQPGSTVLLQTSTSDIPLVQIIGGSDAAQQERGGLRDIALKHAVTNSPTGTGYKAINSRQNILENVYVASFNVGIEQGDNCWQWAMRNVRIMDAAKCLFSHDEGEDSTYTSCIFRSYRTGGIGVHMKNMAQANLFLGCDLSNNATGAWLEQGDNAGNGTGAPYPMAATLVACQMENNSSEAIKLDSSNGSASVASAHPQLIVTGGRSYNSENPNSGQVFIRANRAAFVRVDGVNSQGYSTGIVVGSTVGQLIWKPGPGAQFGTAQSSGPLAERIYERPTVRLTSDALSYTATNYTTVPFNQVASDVAGWKSGSSIVPKRSQDIKFHAQVGISSAPLGSYILILNKNGTNIPLMDVTISTAGNPLIVGGEYIDTPNGTTDNYSVTMYSTASFAINTVTTRFTAEVCGG